MIAASHPARRRSPVCSRGLRFRPMFRRYLPFAALFLGVGPVAAQTESPPPHLSVLEGRASVTRGADREPAVANTPLILGDQLATDDGRAEVLLGDGSALHLDERTTVDFNG